MARLLDRLAPKLAIPSGIPPSFVSRDPEVVRVYDEDNRRVRKITVRWASVMEAATERALGAADFTDSKLYDPDHRHVLRPKRKTG